MLEFTGERVVPDQMGRDARTYQEHLARYVWALPYCVDKSVLDAACGCGYGTDLISGVAQKIIGLDNSEEALKYATQKYQYYGKLKNFWLCDFEKEHFSKISWKENIDVVVSFETIEHLQNPDFFLQNVKNALVRGGLFVFSIPNTSAVKYHKKLYDKKMAYGLIKKYFSYVECFGQVGTTIGKCEEDSDFFLGVATKK